MLLTLDYAEQYRKPCLKIEMEAPRPEPGTNAEAWVNNDVGPGGLFEVLDGVAWRVGAVYEDEPGSVCLVLEWEGRPQELYTREAVLRTLKQWEAGRANAHP